MPATVPPSVELAFQQLSEGLQQVGANDVDLMKSQWADIERGIARLLGGKLDMRRPEHQAVALGLAAAFGKRLAAEDGGFWAQNRESPDGLIMGFPDAVIMLSPFSAVMDALSRSNLARLEDVVKEIRTALGRARLSLGGKQARLGPEEYERLFDPAFIQFVRLDSDKLKEAWERPTSELSRNVRDALNRATQLPAEIRTQMESQLLGTLGALDPNQGVMAQLEKAGRFAEFVAHLVATTEATRPAPEEFLSGVVFPLLFIGAPTQFPPLDEEEREAAKQGVDPLFLYLDLVPYQTPAAEDGLLGALSPEDVGLPHQALGAISPLRLLAVKLDRLGPALEKFDPEASKRAFKVFSDYVREQTGTALNATQSEPVINEAITLLAEMKKVWAAREKGLIALRRLTEAEASSEPALTILRNALNGPRIILA